MHRIVIKGEQKFLLVNGGRRKHCKRHCVKKPLRHVSVDLAQFVHAFGFVLNALICSVAESDDNV